MAPSPEKAKLLIDVKIEGFKVGKKGTYAILDKNNEGDCSVKGVMALKYQCFSLFLGIFFTIITAGIFLLVCFRMKKLF